MKLMDLKDQGIDIQENVPLSRFTFTQTGGPAGLGELRSPSG